MSLDWISVSPELAAGAVGVLVVLALTLVFWWQSRAGKHDDRLFSEMAPLLEELWPPLRHLADLKSVWPDLTGEQRAEIEASSVYQERFHEKRAESLATEAASRARNLRALKNWRLRAHILDFLVHWRDEEPDNLKVLIALVKKRTRRD